VAVFKCAGRKRLDDDGEPYCTYESLARWTGRCPSCGRFYDCDKVGADRQVNGPQRVTAAKSVDVKVEYIATGIEGLDTVLGGGLVRGNVILFGGPAGSGKTSMLLGACDSVTRATKRRALYASAEEFADRVLVICKRVGVESEQLEIMGRDEAHDVDSVLQRCDEIKPLVAVFDSLQELRSGQIAGAPGSSTHAEGIAHLIYDYCKRTQMCAFVVNHMNKELDFKGGTGVSHAIDAMVALYKFNESDDGSARDLFGKNTLRAMGISATAADYPKLLENKIRSLVVGSGKSRQGSIGAKAYFEMTEGGQLRPMQMRSSLDIGG
jgi:predicted ATP-dependent serine protease